MLYVVVHRPTCFAFCCTGAAQHVVGSNDCTCSGLTASVMNEDQLRKLIGLSAPATQIGNMRHVYMTCILSDHGRKLKLSVEGDDAGPGQSP